MGTPEQAEPVDPLGERPVLPDEPAHVLVVAPGVEGPPRPHRHLEAPGWHREPTRLDRLAGGAPAADGEVAAGRFQAEGAGRGLELPLHFGGWGLVDEDVEAVPDRVVRGQEEDAALACRGAEIAEQGFRVGRPGERSRHVGHGYHGQLRAHLDARPHEQSHRVPDAGRDDLP